MRSRTSPAELRQVSFLLFALPLSSMHRPSSVHVHPCRTFLQRRRHEGFGQGTLAIRATARRYEDEYLKDHHA